MTQNHTFRGTARQTVKSEGKTQFFYHATPVVTVYRDGSIMLDSGGWKTATTKTAMNQASNENGLGFRVTQRAHVWYVDYLGSERVFDSRTLALAPSAQQVAA